MREGLLREKLRNIEGSRIPCSRPDFVMIDPNYRSDAVVHACGAIDLISYCLPLLFHACLRSMAVRSGTLLVAPLSPHPATCLVIIVTCKVIPGPGAWCKSESRAYSRSQATERQASQASVRRAAQCTD